MSKPNEHIVSVDGIEYVPRIYAIATGVKGGQICPTCGGKESYVYDTRLDYKYKGTYRRRVCLNCDTKWKTLEIMYPSYERNEDDDKTESTVE